MPPAPLDFSAARRDSLERYLRRHVSGEVRFDDTSRRLYSTDASHYQILPLGVVLPKSADDVAAAVQIAAELGLPVTARGGGTSLSGQAIGPGVVLDCSKYLNRLLDIDPTSRTARVEPGLVLDHFNKALASKELQFGPDVAPANRATLGGMIGNNSAGARSVVYGMTVAHVVRLETVLSDGTPAQFGPVSPAEWERQCEARTLEGGAYRAVGQVVRDEADEIHRRFPPLPRRASGYNLAGVLPTDPAKSPGNLVPLLVGSEGTLAVVTAAEVRLVPRPRVRGLLVPQFARMPLALDAVAACLEASPSAVELMDRTLLDLARRQRELRQTMASVRGDPDALLMVEFTGDTPAEVAAKIERLARRLRGTAGMTACPSAIDPATRDPLWSLRGAAVPLLSGMPGKRKPVTFVEDCAVAPARLPEFAARFRAILTEYGTHGAFYGHASVGCLHIRPVLDLHDPADVVLMRRITERVLALVREFGGALSGEHGDGLVRSEWNAPLYGPRIAAAFQRIKAAFDPANILNPGKVVGGPRMEENLRVPPGVALPNPPTAFDYAASGGYFASVEVCNGSAVCRKTQGGAMCPSFRATRDELDTPRARANALRVAAMAGVGVSVADRWIEPVMDLCLGCKACKSECPSNVDVAKLKAEFLHALYRNRRRPLGHLLVKNVDRLSPAGAEFAGAANWLGRRPALRAVLESVAGVDRRRPLPILHRDHFRRWFRRRRPRPPADPARRVVFLDDCFTTFQEPNVGRSAVLLLEAAGYTVELAGVCCGRAMTSKGFLAAARDEARRGLRRLAPSARAGVPIVGVEPSCLLTLADEWPELVPGDAAQAVAGAAELAEAWIARRAAAGDFAVTFARRGGAALLHGHCHQKALVGVSGTTSALGLVPGLAVTTLDAGCCGMAGAFGYERKHYDISVRIAELELAPAVRAAPNAAIVATGTSCRHQIRDVTGRTALHPVEVLAAAGLTPA